MDNSTPDGPDELVIRYLRPFRERNPRCSLTTIMCFASIAHDQNLTVTEMTKALKASMTAVCTSLAELEDWHGKGDGLITLVTDADDRRKTRALLTDRGRKFRARILEHKENL